MTPRLPYGLPIDQPFTTDDARAAGVRPNQLTALLGAHVLKRPFRGVYLAADCPDSLAVRVACLRAVIPADSFAADHTAAWLHGGDSTQLPNADLVPSEPVFFRPSEHRALRRTGCESGERHVLPQDLTDIGGVLVTTPLRTAWDLGRLQHRDAAMAGLDSMMRVGEFGLDELWDGVERFKAQRGVVQLRALAPLADPGAESFGESALRLRWWDAGLPRPETQIVLMDNEMEAARLDMGLRELFFAAEYDGQEWHLDEQQDQFRRAWVRDRFGYDVLAVRQTNVFGREQDAPALLRRAWVLALEALPGKRTYVIGARRSA